MDLQLTPPETRVLGCLIEKEFTTPDYYPLTLNALINACNQKSNREPVVSFDQETVQSAISALKSKNLVFESYLSRASKYEENFTKAYQLVQKEAGILCVLLLRGPQTLGEIRGRAERIYKFNNIESVIRVMDTLEERELVVKLERQPGCKESRYRERLSVPADAIDAMSDSMPPVSAPPQGDTQDLQSQIDQLREELTAFKAEFMAFKKQFE